MKPRSPVLGYNHNVRYAQMMWHVQTEDSGVQNPHIFTHLFHDGTILATKKLDYDASSDVTTVQKLMQSQHKLMLRELKSGAFDAKIESRYGPIQREALDTVEDTAPRERHDTIPVPLADGPADPTPQDPFPAQAASHEDERATVPDLSGMLPPPSAQPPPEERPRTITPVPPPAEEPTRPRPRLTPSRPSIPVMGRSASSPTIPAPSAAPPPTIGGRAAARSAPPTIGSGRSGAQAPRPPEGGVVVARQTVIVGGESGKHQQREAADFWATGGSTERKPPPDPSFGSDLISEKSLDEVILAYLSEDAPKK